MLNLALMLLQEQPNIEQAQKMAMAMLAVLPFIFIIGFAVVVIPTWFICKKAGFSPWLSLLIIVPFGGIILLYVLAFAEWKVIPAPQMAYMPPVPPYPPPQA
jgi:hypothetical protein